MIENCGTQDPHVSFRANDTLVSALNDRARKAGCSTSEYLRSLVRKQVGLSDMIRRSANPQFVRSIPQSNYCQFRH